MSSTEESDEEFESADEDIDFEERLQSGHQSKDIKHLITDTQNIVVEDNQEICAKKINKNKDLIPTEETNELTTKVENDSNEDKASVEDKSRQSTRLDKCEEIEFKSEDLKRDETVEENESKEQKTVIKGRKLLRKADRIREQTATDGTDATDVSVSDDKINEVLNKLSDLSDGNNTSKWNSWFSDIKSAAMSATSTTVSHVSQASNNWSFDPKSLLSSAATITSTVGTGISSVVGNVTQVVDSAIGAPPPEQMAALLREDKKVEPDSGVNNSCNYDEPNPGIKADSSDSGFGLFDYTLNTLESIGKKTMDVIGEDKQK